MSKHKQSSSDPLPWTQVDRAVKPKAAMLADVLGVSRQHALGSLVEFWDLCGDPRELEAIVEATPPNEEPQILLQAQEVSLRFKLASTHDTEAVTLAGIGLLEAQPDGRFRVRGMSRYFEPIQKRIKARRAAALGGKASAEARRNATGTAQPAGGKGFGSRSVVASDSLERNGSVNRSGTEAPTEAERKRNGSATEADPNPRGQRSEVRDGKDTAPDKPALPKVTREVTDALCSDFAAITGTKYLWQAEKDSAAVKALLAVAPLEQIRSRWRLGLQASADEWASCRTVAQLRSKWNDLASAKPAQLSIEHQPSRIL